MDSAGPRGDEASVVTLSSRQDLSEKRNERVPASRLFVYAKWLPSFHGELAAVIKEHSHRGRRLSNSLTANRRKPEAGTVRISVRVSPPLGKPRCLPGIAAQAFSQPASRRLRPRHRFCPTSLATSFLYSTPEFDTEQSLAVRAPLFQRGGAQRVRSVCNHLHPH